MSYACSYLGTPNLVRETSRKWFWQRQNKGRGQRRDFSDIILQPALHDQVRTLTASSANTRLHQAPFRHMLFYGPPGVLLFNPAGGQSWDEHLMSC